jgi:hypothetical protein
LLRQLQKPAFMAGFFVSVSFPHLALCEKSHKNKCLLADVGGFARVRAMTYEFAHCGSARAHDGTT